MENNSLLQPSNNETKILTIRNQQVMIDRDLAELYGVETKRLNEQVKRNIERFPERFMFQLSDIEFGSLRSQIATSKTDTRGGRQYLPYAITEQGVAMLSAVLKSETAVKVSIQIMEAFVAMRHFLQNNANSEKSYYIKRMECTYSLKSNKKVVDIPATARLLKQLRLEHGYSVVQ